MYCVNYYGSVAEYFQMCGALGSWWQKFFNRMDVIVSITNDCGHPYEDSSMSDLTDYQLTKTNFPNRRALDACGLEVFSTRAYQWRLVEKLFYYCQHPKWLLLSYSLWHFMEIYCRSLGFVGVTWQAEITRVSSCVCFWDFSNTFNNLAQDSNYYWSWGRGLDPRYLYNFKCGLALGRGPPSLARTTGLLLNWEAVDLINKVDINRLDGDILSYYYLPVNCRSQVDRCGSLGSCKSEI